MLIDFHTHFFSRSFFEAMAGAVPGADSVDERLARVSEATGLELPSRDLAVHLSRWLDAFETAGVDHAVTFASLPEEIPSVTEAARAAGGRLSPFALVNPRAPAAAADVRRLLADDGYRGLLLFPAMLHFDMRGPEVRAVLDVANEFGAIVVVHCGMLQVKLRDLLGLPRPYDLSFANPLDVLPAANACRDVRFVIPHFGAGFLRETLMLGAQCENAFVDTSSSNAWMATQASALTLRDVFDRALGVFGPERVLFGTDSCTFPRGWRADIHDAQRSALAELGASAETQALVFGGNASRLLGLGPQVA